ncbi:MAG: DUF1579 family protein [Acidobacteriia bacterium]|nr:DUF1579 family protein [Terriglobia bacterium]
MTSPNRWAGILLVFCVCVAGGRGLTQDQPETDGPKRIFRDPLLEMMLGNWKATGKVRNRSAEHTIQAEWVLNHQFLRIHEKDETPAKEGSVPYEAIVMVGYDNTSDRYVAHWMDVYGGRISETLGYATRVENEVRFVFEYPDGPFHTTFRWKPDAKQWEWLMTTKDETGHWIEFADLTLARSSGGRQD